MRNGADAGRGAWAGGAAGRTAGTGGAEGGVAGGSVVPVGAAVGIAVAVAAGIRVAIGMAVSIAVVVEVGSGSDAREVAHAAPSRPSASMRIADLIMGVPSFFRCHLQTRPSRICYCQNRAVW